MMKNNTDNSRRRTQSEIKTARLATAGLMIALAFILSYIESLLPSFTGVPGVKAGLANIVTMAALYSLGWQYAAIISLVRVVLSGLIFTGMSAMLYSLAGAVLSLLAMLLLYRIRRSSGPARSNDPARNSGYARSSGSRIFSLPAVSVAGGVAHNIGQILVAWAVLGSAVLYYLPVLIISGLIAGIVTGIIAALVCRSVPTLL